jgi:hypothetical protein
MLLRNESSSKPLEFGVSQAPYPSERSEMKSKSFQIVVGLVSMITFAFGQAQNPKRCNETGPPSIWVVKSPYPFQAGAERTFDELYHGPWRARVDIDLYSEPRGQHAVGAVRRGTVVKAVVGESMVVHPIRLIAAQDFRVTTGPAGGKSHLATVRKGDVFWVLNVVDEGEFTIWWRCNIVGWDSTEPSDVDENQLEPLGGNEERWVKVRDQKTGLSGWFKDVPVQGGPKLIPAQPTTKSTG